MTQFRKVAIIPGAVGADSIRALVLSSGPSIPTVTVDRAQASVRISMTALNPTPTLAAELARQLDGGLRFTLARASGLAPDERYTLIARVDDEQVSCDIETLPALLPPGGLTIVVASCFYGYFNKDAAYLSSLKTRCFGKPAFKLLIGDNLYLDVAPNQRDVWGGYKETVERYLHYFWRTGYLDVLSYLPTMTTWDDHEFWNNYPERQCHLARSRTSERENYIAAGDECIRLFQYPLNPPADGTPFQQCQSQLAVDPGLERVRSYTFEVPPLSFFVADTRTHRQKYTGDKTKMMPEGELLALESWAAHLQAPGVFVVGQPLWMKEGSRLADLNPPSYPEQFARIWRALDSAPHDILVVSGDVHHSRILEIGLTRRSIYEFVTSPACHIPTEASVVFGGNAQGRDSVDFPTTVPIDARIAGALKPRLLKCAVGTEAQNSFGVLEFKGLPDGVVSVSYAFIDSGACGPAEKVNVKRWPADPRFLDGSRCLGVDSIRLR